MLGRTLPNEPLRLETEKAPLSQHVASQRSSRVLWTGFGFAALMITGFSACALVPYRQPSHLVAEVAFSPALPALNPIRGRPTASRPAAVGRGERAVMNAQVLVRPVIERPVAGGGGPPSPPPPSDHRPEGGGSGGGDAFLRRLTDSEAVPLLDDWVGMVRVIKMGGGLTGDEDLSEKYTKSLEDLQAFHSFSQTSGLTLEAGQKMIMGMFKGDSDDVSALAAGSLVPGQMTAPGELQTGEEERREWNLETREWSSEPIGVKGKFVVKFIAVSPAELRADTSFADLAMRQGLRGMAEQLGVELEFVQELSDPE